MHDPRKAQGNRLKDARKAAGYRSAAEAAEANGWKDGTYRTHEAGTRTIGPDDAEKYAKRFRARGVDISAPQILFDDAAGARDVNQARQLAIMGWVGAGAEIDTEFEQAPPEGFEQVELPFPISDDLVGYRVRGESMSPTYEPDEIVVVDKRPSRIEALIGDRAIVLAEGPNKEKLRYLKRIRASSDGRPGRYDLESVNFNSPTIRNVRILQASAVRMAITSIGVRPMGRPAVKRKK